MIKKDTILMLSELLKEHLPIDRFKLRGKKFYSTVTKAIEDSISVINLKHGWEERKECPVCGNANSKFEFSRFGIDIVACLNCSLRYLSKIPVNPDDIYSDSSYLNMTYNAYINFYDYRKERFGKERLNLVVSQMGSLKGKRLLDIGSGCGYFLECAKEAGADCIGIELADYVREWAKERVGVPMVKTSLEEFAKEEIFDVITMFDVIEHVVDPVNFLRIAREHLTPSGILVIFTPNFESFGIKVMKEKSNLIAPDGHLIYFTKDSLKFICQKCSLKINYLETFGMDVADILAFFEETQDLNQLKFLSEWEDVLQAIINKAGVANHLRVIAQKI